MRGAISVICLVLALAGQQKRVDAYASAIAKYIRGERDAAFKALAPLTHPDIQNEIEASVMAIRANGGSVAARRRLEAVAMLHTEYALLGGLEGKEVTFQIDMARLALSVARLTLAGQDPMKPLRVGRGDDNAVAAAQVAFEEARAREFVPRWSALAASAALSYGSDQQAITLVNETLKLLPDNQELLFWRGVVMEFQAVWVGEPISNSRSAMPSAPAADPSGYDMLTNSRLWAPVEEAFRHALARGPDDYEAHLHRGYALYCLRQYAAARSEYEVARDRSTDPFVGYMADLLLARLKEDQNDLAGAAQDYERALARIPGAQSAVVGLSLLEARRGNTQRARELTIALASIPEPRRVRDPWWAYHTARIPEHDLAWLGAAVRH